MLFDARPPLFWSATEGFVCPGQREKVTAQMKFYASHFRHCQRHTLLEHWVSAGSSWVTLTDLRLLKISEDDFKASKGNRITGENQKLTLGERHYLAKNHPTCENVITQIY